MRGQITCRRCGSLALPKENLKGEKDDGMTSRTHVTNPEVKHWHGRRLMPQVEQVMLFQEGSGPQERRHSLDKV